jgi:hypothetical protein
VPRHGRRRQEGGIGALREVSRLLALVVVGLGVAMIVATARADGGVSIGYLLGALFVAAGAGRLYLLRRR